KRTPSRRNLSSRAETSRGTRADTGPGSSARTGLDSRAGTSSGHRATTGRSCRAGIGCGDRAGTGRGCVAKGTEGKLLVDKKKISPKDAADAKKECGGGIIYKGRCKGEEGLLVFEIGKEPPGNLNALTKKTIKQTAGLTLD